MREENSLGANARRIKRLQATVIRLGKRNWGVIGIADDTRLAKVGRHTALGRRRYGGIVQSDWCYFVGAFPWHARPSVAGRDQH